MTYDDALRECFGHAGAGVLHSSLPLLVIDEQDQIVLASTGAGELVGWQREDLVGRSLNRFLVSQSDLIECRRLAEEGRHESARMEIRNSVGEVMPVLARCDPFTDLHDRTAWLVVLDHERGRDSLAELRSARLSKLSLLNQVSEALYGANLTLDQVLEAVLICMTAGQGLRFNRAFLLLIDDEQEILQGEIAIGPSNPGEASRIWEDLAEQPTDLFEMMTSYDSSLKTTDVVVNEIVQHMRVPLDEIDHILIRAMQERQAFLVGPEMRSAGTDDMRRLLSVAGFAVAPLTTRRGPLGVIIADNAISHSPITDMDLEFLQLFANQSANAIENSRLYHELERRLVDLRKAAQRQKQDQETLLRMERLSVMGETSAIVAHELRNPLVAIGGFARTLQRSLQENDPNRKFADIIAEEVLRLETIIHDLLDFIRPQKLRRTRADVVALVEETVGRYADRIKEAGAKLVFDLQDQGVEIKVNPSEIQQVLQNLTVNAIQVLPEGGQLLVRTRLLEGGMMVEILDDGPGFADDTAEKLFSPFFSTKTSGSGLGLTICSQIIKGHGGILTASNRPEGGANFSFILPLPKPRPESDTDAE